jgi:hypothetical protein
MGFSFVGSEDGFGVGFVVRQLLLLFVEGFIDDGDLHSDNLHREFISVRLR